MRVDATPTQDVHSLYLRWEVRYDAGEKKRLEALGGPVSLEIETSHYVDFGGVHHETAKFKVPVWPHPGPKNLGQARFTDVDSRRRFWVNLMGAMGTTVVDLMFERKPGSVPKDGVTLFVPEFPATAPKPEPSATA